MTLKAHRRLRLDFESLVEKPHELRWAVARNEQPDGKEWCWAASLANVLAAYGQEAEQADLVREFRESSGELEPDNGKNLAPEHWLPFYRQWFPKAEWLRQPAMPRELKAALYRSPLIGILKNEGGNHLILICGLRRNKGVWEVGVSDSLWKGRDWLGWKELTNGQVRDESDDQALWGPWKCSIILDRPELPGYVFRFVADVGDLRMDAVPPLRRWRAKSIHLSKLEFAGQLEKPFRLAEELSLALLGFLLVYKRRTPESITTHTYLHESIPLHIWTKRPVAGPLMEHFSRLGWHHQLFSEGGKPRQYAQTQRIKEDWRTRWIGRSWVTEAVDRAIVWLDRNAGEDSDEVDMLWLKFGSGRHVHLLRLVNGKKFLVAKASWPQGRQVWQPDERFQLLEESEILDRMARTQVIGPLPDSDRRGLVSAR